MDVAPSSMALEEGEKPEVGYNQMAAARSRKILLMLRLVAFFATAAATLTMALDKETKAVVVATIGNVPITATLTAKFQDTPANIFFVLANAMASLHSFLMVATDLFGSNLDYKGLRVLIVAILDMMTVALVSAAATAAGFMAEVGLNGNSHANWNKICDKFDKFCGQAGWAIILSYIGLLFLMIINAKSIMKLRSRTV